MDDPRTRRDLGLICIAGVLAVIGFIGRASLDDQAPLSDPDPMEAVWVVLAAAGFWVVVICVIRIGVRLIRSR